MNKQQKKINSKLDRDVIPLNPQKPLLRVVGVKKNFFIHNQLITVLKRVELQVKANETIAITGASGSGKSTLLNLLAGIDLPNEGEVYFYQYPLSQLSESQLASLRSQYIGFVFQQHNLIKELTVLENVLLPAMIRLNYPMIKEEKDRLALKLLNQVGLTDRLDHYVGELSGGEAQRVAIVRAFINNPRLILADEPTGNLDQKNSYDVFSLLESFAQTHSTTVIMVTHSKDLAQRCDQVYTIEKGVLSLNKETADQSVLE